MLGDISIATDIYIVTGYTDMRKSIDGLCSIITSQLKLNAYLLIFKGTLLLSAYLKSSNGATFIRMSPQLLT